MEIGMLWFDNDPKSDLSNKVLKAAIYFRKKYGQEPNLCFVHPAMLHDTKTQTGSVRVCSNKNMILHHFWIGVHQPFDSNP